MNTYSPASDVYCLAMVAWEMWYGESVAKHLAIRHGVHLEEALKRGDRPAFSSPQPPAGLQGLIETCWDAKPEARPTLSQLVNKLGQSLD